MSNGSHARPLNVEWLRHCASRILNNSRWAVWNSSQWSLGAMGRGTGRETGRGGREAGTPAAIDNKSSTAVVSMTAFSSMTAAASSRRLATAAANDILSSKPATAKQRPKPPRAIRVGLLTPQIVYPRNPIFTLFEIGHLLVLRSDFIEVPRMHASGLKQFTMFVGWQSHNQSITRIVNSVRQPSLFCQHLGTIFFLHFLCQNPGTNFWEINDWWNQKRDLTKQCNKVRVWLKNSNITFEKWEKERI